jgi:uncharacterized protein (TIGR03086 family)
MRTIDADLRRPDAIAVRAGAALVARLGPADLDRPTPCAGWDVRALLAHMTVQHRGFAAAAAGRATGLSFWRPDPTEPDPISRYADSADQVLAAFAPDEVLDRPFLLPEVSTERPLPARTAIGFHLVDYVVHGWDVAAAVGARFDLPADVLSAALAIARDVPDGPNRQRPGASFAPGLPTPPEAGPMTEILTRLGRSPAWSGESVGGG